MGSSDDLHVEVVFALPGRQSLVALKVSKGTTARAAVRLSGLQAEFPEIDADHAVVGIFGRQVAADTALRDGDRVEIYRPLTADPKEARRRRARKAN